MSKNLHKFFRAALFCFAAIASPVLAAELDARLAPGGVLLEVSGEIKRGDDAEFARHLMRVMEVATRRGRMTVHLQSNGGNVLVAHNIARMLHDLAGKGIETTAVVTDRCSSACLLLFAAPRHRLMTAEARIGVHGISTILPALQPGRTAPTEQALRQGRDHAERVYLETIAWHSPRFAGVMHERQVLKFPERSAYLDSTMLQAIDPAFVVRIAGYDRATGAISAPAQSAQVALAARKEPGF